jgi:hypothetical protein
VTEEDYEELLNVPACKEHSTEWDRTDGYAGYAFAMDAGGACRDCCGIVWDFIKSRQPKGSSK